MGWNTSALFVRDRDPDDVLGFLPDVLEYTPLNEPADGEQATLNFPRDRVYLTRTGRWCQLWEPDYRFDPSTIMELDGPGTMARTRALYVLFSSVSDTHGFRLYDDGAVTRSFIYQQGSIVEESGEPLPIESRFDESPDETAMWSVIKDITGLDYDMNGEFTVHTVS